MDVREIESSYYETAAVVLRPKPGTDAQPTVLRVSHRPIDLPLWEQMMAVENEDSTTLEAEQLIIVDAGIEGLTNGGQPVEYTPDFWRTMHPALRGKVIGAVVSNVPGSVLAAYKLKLQRDEAEKNVEGSSNPA
jgi:hypothetical protein